MAQEICLDQHIAHACTSQTTIFNLHSEQNKGTRGAHTLHEWTKRGYANLMYGGR
jgi:hypothetical protein